MKTAELWDGNDSSEFWKLHKPRFRRVLGQREVGPGFVIVHHERFQVPIQTGLVENDDVVQALAANGADDALHVGALPRRSRRRQHFLNPHDFHMLPKLIAPAILKIDTANFVSYQFDETDRTKFATNPERTTPVPAANFGTFILIADIVAVNGSTARGMHLCRGLGLRTSATPTPGLAIADVLAVSGAVSNTLTYLDCVETILWPDGT